MEHGRLCGRGEAPVFLVADIHFGAHREADVAAFVEQACQRALNPEGIVVIAGDITQRARRVEFECALSFVDQLRRAGLRLVFTPGNHDFGDWIGEHVRTDRRARGMCRELMAGVLSQKEVIASDDFDVIMRCEQDVFVVLRSTHRGLAAYGGLWGNNRIARRQIEWAAHHLTRLGGDAERLHLVTHCSLWHDVGDHHAGMVRGRRFEEGLLGRFDFHAFIHGHNHRYAYARTTSPKLGVPIRHLALPTLSTRKRRAHTGYVRWDFPYDCPPGLVVCAEDPRQPTIPG